MDPPDWIRQFLVGFLNAHQIINSQFQVRFMACSFCAFKQLPVCIYGYVGVYSIVCLSTWIMSLGIYGSLEHGQVNKKSIMPFRFDRFFIKVKEVGWILYKMSLCDQEPSNGVEPNIVRNLCLTTVMEICVK